ncbi:MAG: FliG C-terminal domain-containing protein [Candidatus Sericytochromatia bacterium]
MNLNTLYHWLENHSLQALFESGFLSRCLTQELSPLQKGAIFLMAIGSDTAAPILRRLKNSEVEALTTALIEQPAIDPQLQMAVLDEFEHHLHNPLLQGGPDYAQQLLKRAFPQQAERLWQKLQPEKPGYFGWMAPLSARELIELLEKESAPLQAAVLGSLNPSQAAGFLALLPYAQQQELALQMAQRNAIGEEVLNMLDESLKNKQAQQGQTVALQGRKNLARSLGHVNLNVRERVLDSLAIHSPALESQIRQDLLTLEDLLKFRGRGLQQLLAQSEDQTLAWALKLGSTRLQLHLLAHLSQRRADMVQEYKAQLPPTRRAEAEKQIRTLLEDVIQLQHQGLLPHHFAKEEPWLD